MPIDTERVLARLDDAVMLRGDDAAIRIHAEYEPQAGKEAKVYPPTYLPSKGSKYHIEERWGDGGELVRVVVLDSYQSQANRCEAALRTHAAELGIPQIVIEVDLEGRAVELSSLDVPHRSRDAYFIDSEIDGTRFDDTDVGKALNSATSGDSTAFLRFAPYDLIYGVWDSHRGKRMALKFARAYTSEMLGWHAVPGGRAATKGDPLNLASRDAVAIAEWRPGMTSKQSKKKEVALSELGHGMVPAEVEGEAGGVSVREIRRTAVLSLSGLARYGFPTAGGQDVTTAGRTALATVALLADRLAFARAGLHLRSGSDLALTADRVEWVRRGATPEPLECSIEDAQALFVAARDRLGRSGIGWSAEAVRVRPNAKLKEAIARTVEAVEAPGS